MAAVTRTDEPGRSYLHHWSLTTADPTGDAISVPGASDRCFQAFGTWGGATLVLEGSLDGGTTWFTLSDPQGSAISETANAGKAIAENPLSIRPRLSAVGVGASVDVYLLSRSTMQ